MDRGLRNTLRPNGRELGFRSRSDTEAPMLGIGDQNAQAAASATLTAPPTSARSRPCGSSPAAGVMGQFAAILPSAAGRLMRDVIAPSKARRLLPGESPGRVRVSHPPVSSVGPVAEWRKPRTRDRASVHRESCRPQGWSRSLKCWYSLERSLWRMATVLTSWKPTRSTHNGLGVEVRRGPQAVACRKRGVRELGKP